MRDESSLTAEYMALFRALESLERSGKRLFYDPLAPLFLREWRQRFYGVARLPFGRRMAENC